MVSVWGMSGVGKSFLVRHVYYKQQQQHVKEEEIPEQREFGWVDVSRPFDLMDLSRSLLLDLNPRSLQKCRMAAVKDPIEECREYLHPHGDASSTCKRSFVIVVNGLESKEDWDQTRAGWGLGPDSPHSVIVITSDERVASYCASNFQYMLNVRGIETDRASGIFRKEVCRLFTHNKASDPYTLSMALISTYIAHYPSIFSAA